MKLLLLLPAIVAASFTICACTPDAPLASDKPSTPTSAPRPGYADPQHRFAIAIPAGMTLQHDFQRSYLDHAGWKAFA